MTKFIAAILGVAALTACQTMPSPVAPGQLFPSSIINVKAPSSEGWTLLKDFPPEMIFFRAVSSNESYVGRVVLYRLPETKDREDFVALVKQRNLSGTPRARFNIIEFNYEYTEKRSYPCVRIKGVVEDMAARTANGQEVLKLQTYTLVCRHPRQNQFPLLSFLIEFSHRGSTLDTALDVQAETFLEGVQVPEK